MEFYDHLSFMKAGLTFADALTTVSPSYAHEILTPEGGARLDRSCATAPTTWSAS